MFFLFVYVYVVFGFGSYNFFFLVLDYKVVDDVWLSLFFGLEIKGFIFECFVDEY